MRPGEAKSAIDRYSNACNFEQVVDHAAIETAILAWCREIGAPTDTRVTFVSTRGKLAKAAKDSFPRRDTWDAATARGVNVAKATRAARDAEAARNVSPAKAAWDAWTAWAPMAASAAKNAAKAASAASDARAHVTNLALATRIRRAPWAAEDVSSLAINWVGGVSRGDRRTARIWLPILSALEAGAFALWKAKDEIFVAVIPGAIHVDEARRLHCETGPAFVWLSDTVEYYWHGTRIPDDWLARRSTLAAADVFREQNAEVRRAGCEIIGWDRVLTGIDAQLVDDDGDPQIGSLYEGRIPGAGACGLLKVQCGTGRIFVEPVPAGLGSALAAQAWREDISVDTWTKPEARG